MVELVVPAEFAPLFEVEEVVGERALTGGAKVFADGVYWAERCKSVRSGGGRPRSGERGGGPGTGSSGGSIRLDIEMIELIGVELKLRLAFKDHVILIHLRIHRIDLALSKGVIQSVVDGRRSDTEP